MGNFAENLNLGNRFRPPCPHQGASPLDPREHLAQMLGLLATLAIN